MRAGRILLWVWFAVALFFFSYVGILYAISAPASERAVSSMEHGGVRPFEVGDLLLLSSSNPKGALSPRSETAFGLPGSIVALKGSKGTSFLGVRAPVEDLVRVLERAEWNASKGVWKVGERLVTPNSTFLMTSVPVFEGDRPSKATLELKTESWPRENLWIVKRDSESSAFVVRDSEIRGTVAGVVAERVAKGALFGSIVGVVVPLVLLGVRRKGPGAPTTPSGALRPAESLCPSCGRRVDPFSTFCTGCGAILAPKEETRPP